MKTILTILLCLPTSLLALDWTSDNHHLEPLVGELNTAMNEIGKDKTCEDPPIKPIQYISKHPKTEKWRKHYKMPKLLTADFYKTVDVCAEAKKMNAAQGVKRDYAIIAQKTHFCDTGHRACLATLKSFSDPCNSFIQENFQVFHTRTYVGSFRPSGSKEIQSTYGSLGPSLVVIRLSDCKLVPTVEAAKAMNEKKMTVAQAAAENYFYTPPSMDNAKDDKGEPVFRSENEHLRFQGIKDSLLKNIPELKTLADKKVSCYQGGKRTLPGISDLEEVSYGEIKVHGVVGIRKLMDEQLLEVTGQNPYKK